MVNSPKIRHSKSRRDPVTIDLDAEPTDSVTSPDEPKPEARDAGPADKPLLDDLPPVPPDSGTAEAEAGVGADRPDEAWGAKPADTPAPNPAPRPESKRGGASAIAAGVIGAVLALAGAGALQVAGVLPSPGGSSAEIEALRGELADMRQQVSSAPAPENLAPRLEELSSALADTRSQVEALQSAGPSGVDTSSFDERLAALQGEVDTLRQQDGAVDLAPVTQRLDALEASVGEVEQAASAVTALEQRISAIETQIAELGGRVDEQAQQPGAALAIAASALKATIDRGDSFTTELETYASVAPASPEIEALRGMAASGVPSRTAIADAFPSAANAMISAAASDDPNAGFIDRLMSSAQSLVQVRPVGTVEGDTVPAVVARMEVALDQGNYASAVAEYEKLPEASKEAGAQFIASVKARQAADELIDVILTAALKA